jgi:replication factor C subunit 1
MTIAYKEKVKIAGPVMDQLVEGAQSDMRQIINMMSTYALTAKDAMDFDAGRQLCVLSAIP